MKEQLLLLRELQEFDSRIGEIQRSMEALPEKLAPFKADLAKLEALLEHERSKIAETEAWRAEQEALIKREETAIKEARSKLQSSRNARDYAAANREISNKRRSVSERESEVLKVLEATEATRKALEANEQEIVKLRGHIDEQEKEIEGKVAELSAEMEKHDEERKVVAEKVPAQLLKRYEAVQKRRGVAVVAAKNGDCLGCHMQLPPQLYNELARFESLETCPRCNRLLYRYELLADSEESEAEASE